MTAAAIVTVAVTAIVITAVVETTTAQVLQGVEVEQVMHLATHILFLDMRGTGHRKAVRTRPTARLYTTVHTFKEKGICHTILRMETNVKVRSSSGC